MRSRRRGFAPRTGGKFPCALHLMGCCLPSAPPEPHTQTSPLECSACPSMPNGCLLLSEPTRSGLLACLCLQSAWPQRNLRYRLPPPPPAVVNRLPLAASPSLCWWLRAEPKTAIVRSRRPRPPPPSRITARWRLSWSACVWSTTACRTSTKRCSACCWCETRLWRRLRPARFVWHRILRTGAGVLVA